MHEEKHRLALAEVREAIEEALQDPRGLLPRQRRLMAALSLGTQHLVELWLHHQRAIKPGALVKHEWFQAEPRRLKLQLAGTLTKPLDELTEADRIVALAREVERDRNSVVYGAPLVDSQVLQEKIDAFLELVKAVEQAGGRVWP